MPMESKEIKKRNKKDFSLKALLNVMKYSFDGFIHFYRYERSAIVHLVVAVVIILGGLTMDLAIVEWLFIIFILLVMLSIELLNTAIEAICDLVSPEYNKFVKIAKDSASAATFTISIALIIAIGLIYIPKIISFLGL